MTNTHEVKSVFANAGQGGEKLHLSRAQGGASVPLLLLHGSTIPATVAFCAEFGEASFLGLLAAVGFDAWCMDFGGYGRSYRPDGAKGPVSSTENAVADVKAAVEHILTASGSTEIDIVGWSWGATVAGAFATQGPVQLRRLVLLAPQWLRSTPPPFADNRTIFEEGYRAVSPEIVCTRWMDAQSGSQADEITRAGWDETLKQALADKKNGATEAPNGPMVEISTRWSSNAPVYSPKEISVPVRVIVGSDDPETPPQLVRQVYDEMKGNPDAQYQEIAGATHFVPFEPQREELVSLIATFLKPGA